MDERSRNIDRYLDGELDAGEATQENIMTFATMRSGMVMAKENGHNSNGKNGESSS